MAEAFIMRRGGKSDGVNPELTKVNFSYNPAEHSNTYTRLFNFETKAQRIIAIVLEDGLGFDYFGLYYYDGSTLVNHMSPEEGEFSVRIDADGLGLSVKYGGSYASTFTVYIYGVV